MSLPCKHDEKVTSQVQPTIDLLGNLDDLHPNVLIEHNIEPTDYKKGLVFRSAVESIRGSFIASRTTGREGLARDVLQNLLNKSKIVDYEQSRSANRYDFTIKIYDNPDYFAALEVKGGEGNSINISDRPIWAKEFAVWCHLDGAIVNQPANGAHSIINRLTNELVRRNKLVDVLFFKDILCGTKTRPCPKYPKNASTIGLKTAPDIFLLPERVPTINDPCPPVHSFDLLKLPMLILDLFNVSKRDREKHIWNVTVKIEETKTGKLRRKVEILHQGQIVDTSYSRPWQP